MKRLKPENMDVFNLLTAILITISFVTPVIADDIYLKSGEKLNAKVISKDKLQITIKHPILGELKIAHKNIKNIITDADKAATKAAAAKKTKIDAAAKIKAAAAAKIKATAAKKIKDAAAKIKRIKDKEKQEIARKLKITKAQAWRFHIDLGFNGRSGNSDTLDFRTNFKAETKSPTGRLRYDLSYYTRNTHGEKSANQFRAKVFRDFPMQKAKKWSLFVNGQYDYDDFKSWDYRLSGNGGFGYEFFKEKDMAFTGRIGAGMRREFAEKSRPLKSESVLGLEYRWNLTPKQKTHRKNNHVSRP